MSAAPVILGRRQLYLLPTRNGWLYALMLAVLLLAAVNYGNGLAYGFTFLLGSVAVVSMLYTHRNLFRLEVSVRAGAPVFAGETASFEVHLKNPAPLARLGVAVEADKIEIARVDIAPGTDVAVTLTAPAARRGWLKPPAFRLATRFPFGILYSWSRRLSFDAAALIYPAPAAPQPIPRRGEEAGAAGAGDDFAGVREYRVGDPMQHIAWKAVARGQGWLTKQFGGGLQATVWLDFDALAGLDTETRLALLCRGVLEAEREGARYGLRLAETALGPDRGEAHQQRCLKALALFGLKP